VRNSAFNVKDQLEAGRFDLELTAAATGLILMNHGSINLTRQRSSSQGNG
jgi:hypothetical protein